MCVCVFVYVFTNPFDEHVATQGQFLSEHKEIWIQSFPSPTPAAIPVVCITILPIAQWRIIGFIPFSRICEMQSASSLIWNRFAVSIFYNDNHYTTNSSLYMNVCMRVFLSISECFYVFQRVLICVLSLFFLNLNKPPTYLQSKI